MEKDNTEKHSEQESYAFHADYVTYWTTYYTNLLEYFLSNRHKLSEYDISRMFDELKTVRKYVNWLHNTLLIPSKMNNDATTNRYPFVGRERNFTRRIRPTTVGKSW